jgi:hypothetical protein
MLNFLKRWLGRAPERLRCPYCNGGKWIEGPSSGMSTNIMCAGCAHWFNHHQGIIPMDDLHQVGRDRRPAP